MDLFERAHQESSTGRPLADLLRPRALGDFLGQENAIAPLIPMIQSGNLPSLILWGPPGCGKTTMALLLAQQTQAQFISRNAVDTGAKTLRDIGTESHVRRVQNQEKTILFIDEIHRLNKSQQDVLLPHVEVGDFVLIGATTENPSYELNPALLSRCRLVVFEQLTEDQLENLLERGLSFYNLQSANLLQTESRHFLIESAWGDARRLLNSLEQVTQLYLTERDRPEHTWPLSVSDLQSVLGGKTFYYDKDRDQHYDTISAFIKSIRGSDPDAALYYLARMLKGGEDPLFIARRLVILASEDIGNADPRALTLAISGAQAIELVGLPEGAINLAQVVTYLASAPKSNRSYLGLKEAQSEVEQSGFLPIPMALRSAKTKSMREIGYGQGYHYSHEGECGWIAQQFLPDKIADKKYYEPSDRGFEKNIQQYLKWLKGES